MAKPKPVEKWVRVNFTLPVKLKEEWDDFAKNVIFSSTSQMVRNAVREYMNHYKELAQPQVDPNLQLMRIQNEQMINQKMEEFTKKLQAKPQEKPLEQIKEIKDSILALLEKFQPLSTKELAQFIRLSEDETVTILAILQVKDEKINRTKAGWTKKGWNIDDN